MLKKDITLIYWDSTEKQVAELIAEEAKKRGYQTKITNNKFEKCEIGWYCQHINFPQYSKFSVIMLHDIVQQHGNWPDLWLREPWNKYDIGFLPNKIWIENWDQCSQYYYARPKKGMYLAGWPKADRIKKYLNREKKDEFCKSIGLDLSKPTILYAPSWENDHKQDDFVQAMLKLDVNIVVKQAPCVPELVDMIRCIKEMYELHKDIPGVFLLDPKTNILDAIMVSDILVSEESSTMCEAVMMGKPAISVTNWLIPDVTPSRFPESDYDYVIKTTKEELTDCVSKVLKDYDKYVGEAKAYSENHFSNIGNCIPIMMDVLDSYVEAKECPVQPLEAKPKQKVPFKQWKFHVTEGIKREVYWNYKQRNKFVSVVWDFLKKLKDLITGKKSEKKEVNE